jgi:cysteine sulfinate desulfinase/cysteine desulfurase-like protein
MMTLDASKVYGPKGIGLLGGKKACSTRADYFWRRPGKGIASRNRKCASIVGFAEAFVRLLKIKEKKKERLELKDYFFENVIKNSPTSLLMEIRRASAE